MVPPNAPKPNHPWAVEAITKGYTHPQTAIHKHADKHTFQNVNCTPPPPTSTPQETLGPVTLTWCGPDSPADWKRGAIPIRNRWQSFSKGPWMRDHRLTWEGQTTEFQFPMKADGTVCGATALPCTCPRGSAPSPYFDTTHDYFLLQIPCKPERLCTRFCVTRAANPLPFSPKRLCTLFV